MKYKNNTIKKRHLTTKKTTSLFLLCFLLSSSFCFSQRWTPVTDKALYEQAMMEVSRIEPFSKFLELEKAVITTPSPLYYQARWAFIKDVYHDNPQVSHPKKALDKFILFCTENNLLGAQKDEFIKAAKILGFELITDRVAFEAPSNYKEYLNMAYVYHKGYPQNLDLFVPSTAVEAPVPCIIFIHGGGWSLHKRAWFEGFARYTASKGYAAATIDYRLLPAVDSPLECVFDTKAAVRWVRANAKRFHIDPNKIGAAGASAGGHLAAMLATTADEADLEGSAGNLHVSSRVQAAVGLATPAFTGKRFSWLWLEEKPKWFDTVSPYRYISEGDAPMKFIHGSEDNAVSPEDAKDLYEAYKKNGVFTELEFVEGQGHVFYTNQETAEKVLDFMKRVFEDESLNKTEAKKD